LKRVEGEGKKGREGFVELNFQVDAELSIGRVFAFLFLSRDGLGP